MARTGLAYRRRRTTRRLLRWLVPLALAGCALALGGAGLAHAAPNLQVYSGEYLIAQSRDPVWLSGAVHDWALRSQAQEVTLVAEGRRWVFTLSQLGLTVDTDRLSHDVAAAAARLPWWDRLPWADVRLPVSAVTTWDSQRLSATLAPVRAALERQAVPAELRIVDAHPVIYPEVEGILVDFEALGHALQSLGDDSVVQLPLIRQTPAVTQASLSRLGIKRLIAAWKTDYDPTIPRAENVERAAKAFDGLIVKQGEILSYNATVGPVSADTGWKEAWVIENGKLVPGVGGGVCQVATTLYGAALRADLEILERHPHQLAVWYIPPSQDAAIAPGWEDLKFRNTTPGAIYLQTEAKGGSVTFRIYGDLPAGEEVKIESKVTGSRPFATREVVDSALRPGQRVVQTKGQEGVLSEGYRLVYRDGALVRRELLSQDAYLPTDEVVARGPAR